MGDAGAGLDPVGGRSHHAGYDPVGGGPRTQLALGVLAPGPKGAVAADGQGVVVPDGDENPFGGTPDLLGGGLLQPGAGSRVADLAVIIGAPSPQGAVGPQAQAMGQ